MGTMYMGIHYDEGVKSGYTIDVDGFGSLYCVAYKDKKSVLNELKQRGYTDDDISVTKVEKEKWEIELN